MCTILVSKSLAFYSAITIWKLLVLEKQEF